LRLTFLEFILRDSAGTELFHIGDWTEAEGIDLTDLAPGVFFVRIESRDGRERVLRGVKG
jgi:hypothetical protein